MADATSTTPSRVRAFDWLRGAVVPLMIQCHALSLLWTPLRKSPPFFVMVWLDGLVAPAFILTAGFALGLLEVRAWLNGTREAQLPQTLLRIGRVLAAATLVNWMWFPLFREPHWLFRVDILHCIALSLLVCLPFAALLAGRERTFQIVAWGAGAAILVFASLGDRVHGPLAMLANTSTGAVFPLLPWAGYVFVGAALGAHFARHGMEGLVRMLWVLTGVTALLWVGAPLYKHLYAVSADSHVGRFHDHVPRLTLLGGLLLGFLRLETSHPAFVRSRAARVMATFGRNSLVAYIFHEAALYWGQIPFNLFALFGHRAPWPTYLAVTGTLIVVTYWVGVGLDRLPSWSALRMRLRARGAQATGGVAPSPD